MNKSRPEPPDEGSPLAARVRDTLDRATSVEDPELSRRVRAALAGQPSAMRRAQARRRLVAGGLALAVGVFGLAVLPLLRSGPDAPPTVNTGHLVVASVEDPEFLENLDMLDTLGEDNGEH